MSRVALINLRFGSTQWSLLLLTHGVFLLVLKRKCRGVLSMKGHTASSLGPFSFPTAMDIPLPEEEESTFEWRVLEAYKKHCRLFEKPNDEG